MEKFIPLIGFAIVGYLGYDFYIAFHSDPNSPLVIKQVELENIKRESAGYVDKIKKAEEFNRGLEQKVAELRLLSAQLEEFKVTLSEDFDAGIYGTLAKESERAGVQIAGYSQLASKPHEFYDEVTYRVNFRAVYIQFLVFLERLTKLDKIVRPSIFTLSPYASDSTESPYIELKGTLQINTYRYKGTKADDLGTPGATESGGKS